MSPNPWGPNEPASTVLAEEAWLQGALVAAIAYGVLLTLFCQCVYLFLKLKRHSSCTTKLPFIVVVFLVFMFSTFFTGSNLKFTQQAFIEDRNYPGGPSAYENDLPSDSLGSVSYVLSQWLCDALIVWRYAMIYKGCFVPMWIILTPPCLVYMGSVVTGILYLVQLSAASPFVNTNLNWTIPYISISLGLNILLTIAIVLRLLLFRRRIASALGPTHGSQYTSIAAMVVESASLYSIFSILLLVPFALGNSIASVFLQVIGQVQGCATLLIVLRVAGGKAWSTDTKQMLTSMQSSPVQMSSFRVANFPQDGSIATVGSCMNGPLPCSNFKSTSTGTICAVSGATNIKDKDTKPSDVGSANGAYDRV